jgi:hypothetical protein
LQAEAMSHRDKDQQTYEDQMTTNLVVIIVALVLLIGGFWLLTSMDHALKSEQCLFSGWRHCGQIETPRR